jgi:RNA polymerase-binding transcription factor DksA
MLSKEQGSLYEIDEALKRIEDGNYGICEICEKPIKHDRLEALREVFRRHAIRLHLFAKRERVVDRLRW